MKKICVITTTHSASGPRIFNKEVRTLLDAGYRITLIAQHDKTETIDGIKIIPLLPTGSKIQRFYFLAKKAYSLALVEQADLYHFHDPELLPWMASLKKKTGAKVIYDAHEDVPEDLKFRSWLPWLVRPVVSKVYDWYEKSVSKKFDYVITVNPTIENKFRKKGVSNIGIVSNYPILEKIKGAEGVVHPEMFAKKDKPRLIYVGSLSVEYGMREMIAAMGHLAGKVEFVMVGNFEDEKLEAEVKAKNIKGLVFTGKVPYLQVFSYLKSADVAIMCFSMLPNNYFNTGIGSNKLFEYMAVGLPVIASGFPNLKKIVEGNGCGICVDSSKAEEISEAVIYLLSNKDVANKMGENGKKVVYERYNWENEGKKLLAIYKTILH